MHLETTTRVSSSSERQRASFNTTPPSLPFSPPLLADSTFFSRQFRRISALKSSTRHLYIFFTPRLNHTPLSFIRKFSSLEIIVGQPLPHYVVVFNLLYHFVCIYVYQQLQPPLALISFLLSICKYFRSGWPSLSSTLLFQVSSTCPNFVDSSWPSVSDVLIRFHLLILDAYFRCFL